MSDPLRTVHDALENAGCDPRGPLHKFTARCPAHEDRRPSLSVAEGADGRAVLYCFAGCDVRDIIAALGLGWQDLFREGHRNGRPHRILAKPRAAIDLVLSTLRELEIAYRPTRSADFWIADFCPACGQRGHGVLWLGNDAGRVWLSCFNGCPQADVLAALTGTLVAS